MIGDSPAIFQQSDRRPALLNPHMDPMNTHSSSAHNSCCILMAGFDTTSMFVIFSCSDF